MCGRLDSYIYHFTTLPDVVAAWSSHRQQNYQNLDRPLLLLTILEMVGCKAINRNFIVPTTALLNRFEHLVSQYPSVQNCENLAIPFIGLQSTSFWLLRKKQVENDIPPINIKNVEHLRKYYWGAKLSEDLFPLLVMDKSRIKLEQTLIEKYLLR